MIRRSSTLAWADLIKEPDRSGADRSISSFTTLSFQPTSADKVSPHSSDGACGACGSPLQSPFRSSAASSSSGGAPLVPTTLSSAGGSRRLSFSSLPTPPRRSFDSSAHLAEHTVSARQDSLTLASRRGIGGTAAIGCSVAPQRGVISPPGSYSAMPRPLSGVAVGGGSTAPQRGVISPPGSYSSVQRPLSGGSAGGLAAGLNYARRPLGIHSNVSPRSTDECPEGGSHVGGGHPAVRRTSLIQGIGSINDRPASRGVGHIFLASALGCKPRNLLRNFPLQQPCISLYKSVRHPF